jgi:hypothetical protein
MSKSDVQCLGPCDPVEWRGTPGQYDYTVFVWHGKPCRKCKRQRDNECECVWTEVALVTQDADEADRVCDMLCRAGCEAVVGRERAAYTTGTVLSARDFPRQEGTRLRDPDKVAKYLKRVQPGTRLRLLIVTDDAVCYDRCGAFVRVDNGLAYQLDAGRELVSDLRFVSRVQQLSAESYMEPRRALVYELATRLVCLQDRYEKLRPSRRKGDVRAKRRLTDTIERLRSELAEAVERPEGT